MTDVSNSYPMDVTSEVKDGYAEVDSSQRENAVGYNEYLEARDLEFSDAEVRHVVVPVLLARERCCGVLS